MNDAVLYWFLVFVFLGGAAGFLGAMIDLSFWLRRRRKR